MQITNSTAIVTGGGSGMGAATAKLLSQNGAHVAIFDLNQTAANKIADETNGLPIVCNVTDETSVQNALATVISHFGPPRICINCAGMVMSKRMVGKEEPLPLDEFKKIIEVNLIFRQSLS